MRSVVNSLGQIDVSELRDVLARLTRLEQQQAAGGSLLQTPAGSVFVPQSPDASTPSASGTEVGAAFTLGVNQTLSASTIGDRPAMTIGQSLFNEDPSRYVYSLSFPAYVTIGTLGRTGLVPGDRYQLGINVAVGPVVDPGVEWVAEAFITVFRSGGLGGTIFDIARQSVGSKYVPFGGGTVKMYLATSTYIYLRQGDSVFCSALVYVPGGGLSPSVPVAAKCSGDGLSPDTPNLWIRTFVPPS